MGSWLVAIHAAALLVLPFMMLPLWIIPLLAGAVLCSLYWCWPRYASRRAPGAIRLFTWLDGTDCVIGQPGNDDVPATLAPYAFILPWLVILYFRRGTWRRECLVILPDMVDDESFRLLRVRLKMAMSQT
jgi:hypothetical protein